jgi:hypothetical protein
MLSGKLYLDDKISVWNLDNFIFLEVNAELIKQNLLCNNIHSYYPHDTGLHEKSLTR